MFLGEVPFFYPCPHDTEFLTLKADGGLLGGFTALGRGNAVAFFVATARESVLVWRFVKR